MASRRSADDAHGPQLHAVGEAEKAGYLDRQKRNALMDRLARATDMRKASSTADEKAVGLMEQFKTACPALPTL